MKLKVELASNELRKFIEDFFKEIYSEEIKNLYSNFGDFTVDEFVKIIESKYDRVNKTIHDIGIKATYFSSKTYTREEISRERLDFIVKNYVKENLNLDVSSVKYSMIVNDNCISQVENPQSARCVEGIMIAECTIKEKEKVKLNMI